MPRLNRELVALFSCYFVFALVLSALSPLRLGEINQSLISLNFSWTHLMQGIAALPGAMPFGYLVQLPFILLGHHSRIVLRLPSLLAAVANCWLILRLIRYTPVRSPLAAAAVFLFLPIHVEAACDSRSYELALMFLLLAAIRFLELLERPDFRSAAIFSALLTLCIYTQPFSYVAALGYLLFLLRFASGLSERRALWFVLPATVLPAFLYLPYYAWASPQRSTKLLSDKLPLADAGLWTQTLHSLAPGMHLTIFGAALLILLAAGLCAGVWSSFLLFAWPLKTRINLFVLAGGSALSILLAMALAAAYRQPLTPQNVLFAAPGLVLVTFSAVEWLIKTRAWLKPAAYSIAASLLLALCAPALVEFIIKPGPDMGALARVARENMTPDSCIVFVSEGQSPYLFSLYDSGIWKQQCHNFFAKRIVLASHPWVRPDQQRNAELFFRGLNFTETRRIHVQGGLVIVEVTH